MSSRLFTRRLAAIAGGIAIVAMGAITAACGNNGTPSPSSTTTTTTTTTTSVSPTQNNFGSGGNLFTPPALSPATTSGR